MILPNGDDLERSHDLERIRWKLWDRILSISNIYGARISFERLWEDPDIKSIVSELSADEDFKAKCCDELDRWYTFLLNKNGS
jgi:hypothetical protein